MGKLRQWFRRWFDYQIEKSFQRHANKLHLKEWEKNNPMDWEQNGKRK